MNLIQRLGNSERASSRFELRGLFERWFSRPYNTHSFRGNPDERVDAVQILDLSQYYQPCYLGSSPEVAAQWDTSVERKTEGAPSFSELRLAGWLVFDGCSWWRMPVQQGTESHITYPSPATKSFLLSLNTVKLQPTSKTIPPALQALAQRLESAERPIEVSDPDWLAGRLWQHYCPTVVEGEAEVSPDKVNQAFVFWWSWCRLLGLCPEWNKNWSDEQRRYCLDAAHEVLDRQTLWGTWDNDVNQYIQVLRETMAIPEEHLRYVGTPREPTPLASVARMGWLDLTEVEPFLWPRSCGLAVSFALSLIFSVLATDEDGPRQRDMAPRLFSFAAEHPNAMQALLWQLRSMPCLLADLLTSPQMACLATRHLLTRPFRQGNCTERHNQYEDRIQTFALDEALLWLGQHLRQNQLDLNEYAALITWCYSQRSYWRKAQSALPLSRGQQLIELATQAPAEAQAKLLRCLQAQMSQQRNIHWVHFGAVLESLEQFSPEGGVDTTLLVQNYVSALTELRLANTDVPCLAAKQAARLVFHVDQQAGSETLRALLKPMAFASHPQFQDEQGKAMARYSLARTLRIHTRLLARAVTGWAEDTVPESVFDVFVQYVSRNVLEHAEKEKPGALTDRYAPTSLFGDEDGSPAHDLAATWRRLTTPQQEQLLSVILQSDDVVLLTGLKQQLPANTHLQLQRRLRQLTVDEVSRAWTWPVLRQRIEALLAVGEYDLALEHWQSAVPQQDLAEVPVGFRVDFFALELQRLLLTQNWSDLDAKTIPDGLAEDAKRRAQNVLAFYRATSHIHRPDGNVSKALRELHHLAALPDAGMAYKENVLAAALQLWLTQHAQANPLTAEAMSAGETLLKDITTLIDQHGALSSPEVLANRALLYLALDRPQQALDSLSARRQEQSTATLECLAAQALYELGRKTEASAIVREALNEFGANDQLREMEAALLADKPVESEVSSIGIQDDIATIRTAVQRLPSLRPSEIAAIFYPIAPSLENYLTRQVSRAVASLQRMKSILRETKNKNEDTKLEDDLNTAVREVLEASLCVHKWSVKDQSLGGETEAGNPGKRDAVIVDSSTELAIYEALVCTSVDTGNLIDHFHKLPTYGVCELYFHVTYAFMSQTPRLLAFIHDMLENKTPTGLKYLASKPLELSDSGISGYTATYQADYGEITIAFLVVQLKASASRSKIGQANEI